MWKNRATWALVCISTVAIALVLSLLVGIKISGVLLAKYITHD
jgi:hypothetical protein